MISNNPSTPDSLQKLAEKNTIFDPVVNATKASPQQDNLSDEIKQQPTHHHGTRTGPSLYHKGKENFLGSPLVDDHCSSECGEERQKKIKADTDPVQLSSLRLRMDIPEMVAGHTPLNYRSALGTERSDVTLRGEICQASNNNESLVDGGNSDSHGLSATNIETAARSTTPVSWTLNVLSDAADLACGDNEPESDDDADSLETIDKITSSPVFQSSIGNLECDEVLDTASTEVEDISSQRSVGPKISSPCSPSLLPATSTVKDNNNCFSFAKPVLESDISMCILSSQADDNALRVGDGSWDQRMLSDKYVDDSNDDDDAHCQDRSDCNAIDGYQPGKLKSPLAVSLDGQCSPKGSVKGTRRRPPVQPELLRNRFACMEGSSIHHQAMGKHGITEEERTLLDLAHDLWQQMILSEIKYMPREYLERHVEFNEAMRAILVDWMIETCEFNCFKRETLHLAVNFLDRYFSATANCPRENLQLVGATCLWIATKIEVRCGFFNQ
ncbi:hypothetical protein BC936DRAFT_148917 [Jimgerdemannia flammicorona]|uniref:Cyclin N-terminal domain-containing protein n=1 Tax=Jimgerdemannia flammicorona TaxID=994334 RepID=A0A433D212_9FUNG|nr:hypothetical protein BC936DRAFT_148917 [Jimgerdemannia flammicorona]